MATKFGAFKSSVGPSTGNRATRKSRFFSGARSVVRLPATSREGARTSENPGRSVGRWSGRGGVR